MLFFRSAFLGSIACVGGLTLGGCSSSSDLGLVASDAAVSDSAAPVADAASDASASPDASDANASPDSRVSPTDGGIDADAASLGTGSILVDFDPHRGSAFLTAQFNAKGTSNGCPVTATIGPCVIVTCTGNSMLANAGTVKISNGGSIDVTLSKDVYEDYSGIPANFFGSGDVFTVTATGDLVPAFSMSSEPTPAQVFLTSPTSDSAFMAIAATHDVPVTWTGGVAGDSFEIAFDVYPASSASKQALCSFDATLGSGVVPAAALAGFAGEGGSIEYGQTKQAKKTFGGWEITINNRLWTASGANYN